MQIHWLWFVVGLVPYSMKRQHTKNDQMLSVHAFFWKLCIRRKNGHWNWELSLPFIKHWRQ
jgi:hypothetical protein